MAVKTVKTRLVVEKKCKNSVRYNSKNRAAEEVLLTIYVMNAALKTLGNPEEIEVTITSVATSDKKQT